MTAEPPLIAITTDYLRPGDHVDRLLQSLGYRTRHRGPGAEPLTALLDGAVAAIVGNDPLTADLLATCSSLRALVRSGVGYESIDIPAATRLGISVSNLPGVNTVAEYTIGLILSASRHLTANAAAVKAGQWPRREGAEIRGATLGIVAYGRIGREVATLARHLGMHVLCTTRSVPTTPNGESRQLDHPHFVDLDELLASADFVSLHTPVTAETHNLIDTSALTRMKATAVLINTARAGLIDESALATAVVENRIAGAELDVVDREPLEDDSPLRDVPRINVYPHMAGQSRQARRAAGARAAQEVLDALAGAPRSSLNFRLLRLASR